MNGWMGYREMKRSKKKLRALLLAGLIAVSSIYTAGCGNTGGTVVDNSAVNKAARTGRSRNGRKEARAHRMIVPPAMNTVRSPTARTIRRPRR